MMSSAAATLEGATTTKATYTLSSPQVTFLLENPLKSSNWGPLLRCCAAFGIPQIFVVGFDKCSVQGSHGSSKHVELVAFPDHASAIQTLQQDLHFELLGVLQGVSEAYNEKGYFVISVEDEETKERTAQISMTTRSDSSITFRTTTMTTPFKSFPVNQRPFFQKTCLVVSKKTKGLPWSLAQHCTRFVHIPHQGLLGMNDDNFSFITVEAGISIVLHEFALWAGFNHSTNNYQGQKYQVVRKIKGADGDNHKKHHDREQRKEKLADLALDAESCLGCLLMGEDDPNIADY